MKLEKKKGDDDNRRSEQSTSTEILTVPLPTEEHHSCHQEISSTSQQLLKTYVTGESVTKAEILWSMKCVLSHFSFCVSSHMGGLFQNWNIVEIMKRLIVETMKRLLPFQLQLQKNFKF